MKEAGAWLEIKYRVPAQKLSRLLRREGYDTRDDFVNEAIMPIVQDEIDRYINSLD